VSTFPTYPVVGTSNEAFRSSESLDAPMTVGELSSLLKSVVEECFSRVRVVGEISNLTFPRSGHAYFTLKDETAQLSAALWKSTLSRLPFQLKPGLKVVCSGRVEVYPPHGKYQLIASDVEPLGVGALELAFQQLQEKLAREGLFEPSKKKALPRFLRRVGVATSATGAALRDFLNILKRRTKRIDVVVAPTKVQGEGAAQDVVRALRLLDERREELELDAIVLIRGGGSAEDLWTFNEEVVARAVASTKIPIVTGIGHEIDVSLCDLAADVHALTPSDAAARLVPEDDETFFAALEDRKARMTRALERRLQLAQERLNFMEKRRVFQAPREILIEKKERLLLDLQTRLERKMEDALVCADRKTVEVAAKLEAMSPLAVLSRGYSLTKRVEDGKLLRRSSAVSCGQTIETRHAEGVVRSVVIG